LPFAPFSSRRTASSVIGSEFSGCALDSLYPLASPPPASSFSLRSSVAHLATGQVFRRADLVVIDQEVAQILLAGEFLVGWRGRRHCCGRDVAGKALRTGNDGNRNEATLSRPRQLRWDPSSCNSRFAP
jgi:hypothetical protein